MRDKKLWIFNAGNAFEGNPKWLFLYITEYRKDIEPVWFCYKQDLVDYMRARGYKACLYDSLQGQRIGERAGVYVVNQFKEVIQDYLDGITIINLWHGVGCKTVERGVTGGILNERIVKKHIQYKKIYRNNLLFLVTSPMMEKHFLDQCGLEEDQLIRAGYPCNVYPGHAESYNHDLLAGRGLPEDTRIVAYVPTYRDYQPEFMGSAIPDMDRLIEVLERNHLLLILKLHPKMEDDSQYHNLYEQYKNCPNVMFWDKLNDFYEVFDRIDAAIIDYSSIYYDMLAGGVKHFIRYIFDYAGGETESVRDFAFDFMENTTGTVCTDFDQLLAALEEPFDPTEGNDEIQRKFWEYSTPDTFDIIIDRAMTFEPNRERKLPTLYSFDVFDTLITRSCLQPKGIFYYVQDRIRTSGMGFPAYVINNYVKIRPWAEANCREFFNKTLEKRTRTEISFDMIFDRMQTLYGLMQEQIDALKMWELEAEETYTQPVPENIEKVRKLVEAGETVILISDMYLEKAFVEKLLAKADPMLAELPLFLSSDRGVQKTKKSLFLDAYHGVDYRFGEWIHTGDSKPADVEMPTALGITPAQYEPVRFESYENKLVNFGGTFDAFQVAALFARFRDEHTQKENFAYSYASLYFVPYVWWALEDAIRDGMECAYFISRDGHLLKEIADAIIEARHLSIKTKYIYGSRKLWRIPSMIDEIDDEFFSKYGNFQGLKKFSQVLTAGDISKEECLAIFPEFAKYANKEKISQADLEDIMVSMGVSSKYKAHLLRKAAERREIVNRYLAQEIDFTEKYAFIEYWGRGYTQTCLARLLWNITGEEQPNVFYYARSIYPTEGNIVRKNFSGNNYSYVFIEAVLANIPYRSVEKYIEKDGKCSPELVSCDADRELYEALMKYMPQFARDLCGLDLVDTDGTRRLLFDFGLSFFHNNRKDPMVKEIISQLYDSTSIYGSRTEFAPPMTVKDVYNKLVRGQKFQTGSMALSLERSNFVFRKGYRFYKKHMKGRGSR